VIVEGYANAGRIRIINWCHKHAIPCFIGGDSNIRCDTRALFKKTTKQTMLRRMIRKSTGILCCGTLGQEYFQKYGAAAGQIFMYPYEPDYDLIRQLPPERIVEARSRFGLREGRRRLVFSGRLVDIKGVDLLIDAFAAIANQ